jgi:hypothetical protein
MYQKEIEFFFPLTEQIPLNLDYENCSKFKGLSVPTVNGSLGPTLSFSTGISPTWTTTVKSDEIETKKLSIVLDTKPNIVLRWVYKLLNINWKI